MTKHGPFHIQFNGLHASLRSVNNSRLIKSMLVSHAFVELYNVIDIDDSFDKKLFDKLDEDERDFMKFCLTKSNIKSRGFDEAYNQMVDHLVNRLKLLQGARNIGDDNTSIKSEINQLLDKLYQKNVFSRQYYIQFKRHLA